MMASVLPLLAVIGAVVTVVVLTRVFVEERLLCAQYPDYSDYIRTTKALVPCLF